MKNRTELTVLLANLASLLPPDRMNRSLRELSTEALYTSLQAYEEEIRWRLTASERRARLRRRKIDMPDFPPRG